MDIFSATMNTFLANKCDQLGLGPFASIWMDELRVVQFLGILMCSS